MRLTTALLAALTAYVVGSVPFALVVTRWFGQGEVLRPTELAVPDSDQPLRSSSVSATAVRLQLGARYGCLTSILDMAKAAAVTLTFKLVWPEQPYYLIAAGFATIGHVWPIFHRFLGGRGQSPIIGSLFVIDWPTPLITYPLAQVLGLSLRSRAYVGRFAPTLLAAGWLFFRFRSVPHILLCVGLFAIRVIAMRDEIRQYRTLRANGALSSFSEEVEMLHLGDRVDRTTRRVMHAFRRRRPPST
ncbi:glycerol-3-phosphate acyltransferase [Candidatus Bipolaricaulota bacterium]